MIAVFAFQPSEILMQVAAIEVMVNDLLYTRYGFIPTKYDTLIFRLKEPILQKPFLQLQD